MSYDAFMLQSETLMVASLSSVLASPVMKGQRSMRDMIKFIIQSSPNPKMTSKDIADQYTRISNKNGHLDGDVNFNTIRTQLHRLKRDGEIAGNSGSWIVIKPFEVQ
ncbi:MAG: hypothetical protein R3C97_10070 [Geminicoccaceae bacterium]